MVARNNTNSKDNVEKIQGGGVWQEALKKGPWTTEEDAILMDYIRKHGEGNWNAVQRNCRLSRCGKSCRLRWANHLRPDLKKGSFTPAEERLIIELHAKIGNKWARMACQLPGRTDNEIKNYWNTKVKRLQRAGLPIDPDNIPQNCQNNYLNQLTNPPILPPSNSSKYNNSISFANPILNFPIVVNPPLLSHSNYTTIGYVPMPLTNSVSPFTSSPLRLFSQKFNTGGPFSPFALLNSGKIELTSILTGATDIGLGMPGSSTISGSGSGSGSSIGGDTVIGSQGERNSELLEALLGESNILADQAHKLKSRNSFGDGKGKEICEEEDSNCGPNLSPLHSSCGMKKEPIEGMNQLDDDLSSLLNNFAQSVPAPDWYCATTAATTNTDKDYSSGIVTGMTTSTNPGWGMGSSCWNNLPSIY